MLSTPCSAGATCRGGTLETLQRDGTCRLLVCEPQRGQEEGKEVEMEAAHWPVLTGCQARNEQERVAVCAPCRPKEAHLLLAGGERVVSVHLLLSDTFGWWLLFSVVRAQGPREWSSVSRLLGKSRPIP